MVHYLTDVLVLGIIGDCLTDYCLFCSLGLIRNE